MRMGSTRENYKRRERGNNDGKGNGLERLLCALGAGLELVIAGPNEDVRLHLAGLISLMTL